MITKITSISAVSASNLRCSLCLLIVSLMLLSFPVSLTAKTKYKGEVDRLRIEVVSDIPAPYIWHSRSQQVLRDSQGAVIAFWPSDEESTFEKDGRRLLGIAMVGLGDLAESPVAFLVWGKGEAFADDMSSRYVARNGKVSLFFLPRECQSILKCQDAVVALPIRISSDGESVYVKGNQIGKVQGP